MSRTKTKSQKVKPLPVLLLGQDILRKKAKPVSTKELVGPVMKKLVKGMISTCEKEKGVGLAAPQVGISKRMFVIWQRPTQRRPDMPIFGPEAIINPKIVKASTQMKKGYEGCLSIPGIMGNTPRHVHIEVEYTNLEGKKVKTKFSNFLARVFQHEYDHLDGIVYLDRITGKDIITEKEFLKLIAKK